VARDNEREGELQRNPPDAQLIGTELNARASNAADHAQISPSRTAEAPERPNPAAEAQLQQQ